MSFSIATEDGLGRILILLAAEMLDKAPVEVPPTECLRCVKSRLECYMYIAQMRMGIVNNRIEVSMLCHQP